MSIGTILKNVCTDFDKQVFEIHCNGHEQPALRSSFSGDENTAEVSKIILQNAFNWSCDGVERYKIVTLKEEINGGYENAIYAISNDKRDHIGNNINPQILRKILSNARQYLQSLSTDWKKTDIFSASLIQVQHLGEKETDKSVVLEHSNGVKSDLLLKALLKTPSNQILPLVRAEGRRLYIVCLKSDINELITKINTAINTLIAELAKTPAKL